MSSGFSDTSPLDIAIVGAGLGGLAAACALRQQGHQVTVYEKSHFQKEVGAAISLAPNVSTLVGRLGVDLDAYGAIAQRKMISYDAMDGSQVSSRVTYEEGKPFTQLIHRVDLHTGLKEAAFKAGAKIQLGKAIASVEPESGAISFADGESVVADLVLGADGVHSVARKALGDEEMAPLGNSMFRMLIPRRKVMQDEKAKILMEEPGSLSLFATNHRLFLTYPCRNNDVLNVGAIFHEQYPKQPVTADQDLKARMTEIFADHNENVRAVMDLAEDVLLWRLYDRPCQTPWTRGRLALLGDAAHPTLPFTGQGGAQALEDAVTLGLFLPHGTRRDDVPARMQLYENSRRGRAERIQGHGRALTRAAPGSTPARMVLGPQFFEDVWAFDAWEHATKIMDEETKKAERAQRGESAAQTGIGIEA